MPSRCLDALTSDRPLRPACHRKALAYIKEQTANNLTCGCRCLRQIFTDGVIDQRLSLQIVAPDATADSNYRSLGKRLQVAAVTTLKKRYHICRWMPQTLS